MEIPVLPIGDFQTDCGERLRKLIDMLGISQVEAGRLMGVSKHVIRNWLAGENPVQPYALYRLCRARGVDFNFVYLGDWNRLPHELARKIEEEVQASLAVATVVAAQEA
jgi:transcriptional regulator with XRE-family HTH domain